MVLLMLIYWEKLWGSKSNAILTYEQGLLESKSTPWSFPFHHHPSWLAIHYLAPFPYRPFLSMFVPLLLHPLLQQLRECPIRWMSWHQDPLCRKWGCDCIYRYVGMDVCQRQKCGWTSHIYKCRQALARLPKAEAIRRTPPLIHTSLPSLLPTSTQKTWWVILQCLKVGGSFIFGV